MKLRAVITALMLAASVVEAEAIDHRGIAVDNPSSDTFTLIENGRSVPLLVDGDDDSAVLIAARTLQADFGRVTGREAEIIARPKGRRIAVIGTVGSSHIDCLVKAGKLDISPLEGRREMYIMTVVDNPFKGVDEALVIVGSDRRGTVYGIYELSEQIGVSPWYDWADVPVEHREFLALKRGSYTAGEPAVRYRGIFINDEAPCLTSWVKNTYGTDFGDHRFYARVFELLLRLRANFMWPAMWGWSFYADDEQNSRTAHDMGIIMGTSHHEPMARNHQEWARRRHEYGAWDYATNRETIRKFFREGMERAADREDLITVGMRGDGDAPMGGEEGKDHEYEGRYRENMRLMEQIFADQRRIIEDVTGRPASERPQVWAVYKEVQNYYDLGLRPADDVIILVCDDNWGNVRRLPNAEERMHKGGWGMYYHVDYVGAPRNTKWLNVTPVQNLWEQMRMTYDYGVDRLWVLNVGDLKPMEYPITLFLDMAWNPTRFEVSNLTDHVRGFCAQQFGESQADEAARILNLACKYAGRVTPEMLDCDTYNLDTGEWKQVVDEYVRLEAEALRQYVSLDVEYRDAYRQIVLFPVQAMSNLYEMYWSQAMNRKLYAAGDPQADVWADNVERTFARDAELCRQYNEDIAGGKWRGMMTQKHIGYTEWHDGFPADTMPEVSRIGSTEEGGYIFRYGDGYAAIEAEHRYSDEAPEGTAWTVIPHMGRTLSGIELMPATAEVEGASLNYKIEMPAEMAGEQVEVHVIVKSTLAFDNRDGHRYAVGFEGGELTTVNFNGDLNEEPQNIYSVFYPTVARRVVEKVVRLRLPATEDGVQTLTFRPLDKGIVLEKIVVDGGGYKPSYLFMNESEKYRKTNL